MHVSSLKDQQFDFIVKLADDLASKDIQLPSFPAVVTKIRNLLEDETCNFEQISQVVSADAILVSRLFVFANSAYHNQSGIEVVSLEAAISKLGMKVVRNTALSIAVKQLLLAEKEPAIKDDVRRIWTTTIHLAAMSYAVAEHCGNVDPENAFMCGLLHQVGKLYILTSAKEFPEFLGDPVARENVLNDWHQQVGQSIVESWGFPDAVSQSMNPQQFFDDHTHLDPAPVDIVFAAQGVLAAKEEDHSALITQAVFRKLQLCVDDVESIRGKYSEKLSAVQQSLA